MKTINNKYKRLYDLLMLKALKRGKLNRKETYFERHHKIPKSLGGSDKSHNIVHLLAREHFIAHQLLPKFLIGKNRSKMVYAFHRLCKSDASRKSFNYTNSKTYDRWKHIFSENLKKYKPTSETIAKIVKKTKGQKRSEETKRNISNSLKGRKMSEESKLKMRKPKSEEHKRKISIIKRGKKRKSLSIEHKNKLSKIHKGRIISEESKIKISNTLKIKGIKECELRLKCSKERFIEILDKSESIKVLKNNFPNEKLWYVANAVKRFTGKRFQEYKNINIADKSEKYKLNKLKVSSREEFKKICSKCADISEFKKRFSYVTIKFLRNCLYEWYGTTSIFKISNRNIVFSPEAKKKLSIAAFNRKK